MRGGLVAAGDIIEKLLAREWFLVWGGVSGGCIFVTAEFYVHSGQRTAPCLETQCGREWTVG